MEHPASVMRQDQKDVKQVKGGRWNSEEVDGDQLLGVVTQEGLPGLVAAQVVAAGTVFADRRIRDAVASLATSARIRLRPHVGLANPI